MAVDQEYLEFAKIGVAALTPMMTLVVGVLVVHLGTKLDTTKQLNAELLRKRLHLFEEIAPKLNDIFCFYQAVGHWAELDPDEVIKRKRTIDRAIQVNRYLFESDFWDEYQRFEKSHFEMFVVPGRPARLALDVEHMRKLMGGYFKEEWLQAASAKPGSHEDQRERYQALMNILGKEVRGVR